MLQQVDNYTQDHRERMTALIVAAKLLLQPEVTSLMRVHELLDIMWCSCDDLENLVNSEAEDHGCNYVDGKRRALRDAMEIGVSHG